eukprot:9225859-Alexandrium_andersonii.AAC.1
MATRAPTACRRRLSLQMGAYRLLAHGSAPLAGGCDRNTPKRRTGRPRGQWLQPLIDGATSGGARWRDGAVRGGTRGQRLSLIHI